VPHIELQPIEREHDAAELACETPQPREVRDGERHQLVVAVEQVGHRALGDGDVARSKRGVDLRDRAVVLVAKSAHEGDDVETELLLRQGEASLLLLGADGDLVERALVVVATTDLHVQADRPVECDDHTATAVVSAGAELAVHGKVSELAIDTAFLSSALTATVYARAGGAVVCRPLRPCPRAPGGP
jgi:hypothetical protein